MPDDGAVTDRFDHWAAAEYIRRRYREGSGGALDSQMAMLDCGEKLLAARRYFVTDRMYGGWLKQSGFPFSQQTAWTYRKAAEHRGAVEKELRSQVDAGGNPNLGEALKAVTSRLVTNALPRFENRIGEFVEWLRDVPTGSLSPSDRRRIKALLEQCAEAGDRPGVT